MDEKNDSLGSVVVLEEGAEFPRWISEYQRRAPNSVVVAHTHGESMDDLLARVSRRLSGLNGELRVGVVACAPTQEESHLAKRERLCRMLLDALTPEGGGEVVLAASPGGSDASKHAIFELAGMLCDQLPGSNRLVRVRFSSGHSESGIVPNLPAIDSEPDQTEVRLSARARAKRAGSG